MYRKEVRIGFNLKKFALVLKKFVLVLLKEVRIGFQEVRIENGSSQGQIPASTFLHVPSFFESGGEHDQPRSRANSAHRTKSRPESGLGLSNFQYELV